MSEPDTIALLGINNCLRIIETGVRWVVLCLSQDGACTDSFENFRDNSLKGGLSNYITLNPPLFSLVNTFKSNFTWFSLRYNKAFWCCFTHQPWKLTQLFLYGTCSLFWKVKGIYSLQQLVQICEFKTREQFAFQRLTLISSNQKKSLKQYEENLQVK